MRLAIGADHAGYGLKTELVPWLRDLGHDVVDLGAHALDPDDDYPDAAEPVAVAVARGDVERGVVVCGSGVGACVAANKVPGARAATCHDTYSASQGVEHDDMNILCMGERIVGRSLARELVVSFLGAVFTGEERHQRRLDKVLDLERRALAGGAPAQPERAL